MKEGINIWSAIERLISLMLVILALTISAIPLFHSHEHEGHTFKTEATEYTSAIEKCHICDFLIHKQQKEFDLPCVQPVQLVCSVSMEKPIKRPVRLESCTISGFTNKGPPTSTCFC